MSNKRRKVVSDMLRNYELERLYTPEQQQIKAEPRDRTPPHHNISSPPHQSYAPQYEQNWGLDNMQAGISLAGPSHVTSVAGGHGNPFAQEWAGQPYVQAVSPVHIQSPASMQPMSHNLQVLQPNMQAMSPNMQPMSPNMQPLSPNMQQAYVTADRMSPNMAVMSPHAQTMSPHGQIMSPHGQTISPHGQIMSPHGQTMSPHGQTMSPHGQTMSPMGRISPNMRQNMGHISPNLVQQQPTYAQQPQPNLMDTDQHSAASLSHLLMDRGENSLLLNSSELSGLSALLAGDRSQEPQALDY